MVGMEDISKLYADIFQRLGLRVEGHSLLLVEVEGADIVETMQVVSVGMREQDRVETGLFRKIAERLLAEIGRSINQDRRATATEGLEKDRCPQAPIFLFFKLGPALHTNQRYAHGSSAAKNGEHERHGKTLPPLGARAKRQGARTEGSLQGRVSTVSWVITMSTETKITALVTGASGFVGSTLCEELLRRGIATRALMRKTSSSANLGAAAVLPVPGDLRDPAGLEQAVSGADLIFHVAGVVAARSREDFFAANAEGTRNLLQAVRKSGARPKRFVYVSSLAAAGPSRPDRPNGESDPCRPVSDYGLSKLAGEQAVLEFQADFPVCVVRPPAVYGPRDKGIFTFFQAVRRGVLPLLGLQNPDPRRYSFVHVDDLIQGIVKAGLAEGLRSGEVFYASGDGEYSWEEAMRLIARGLEKNALPVRLPILAMKGAAALCTAYGKAFGKVLPFSLDKVKEIEAPAWTCSNRKAKELIGFEPYWALDRGLAHTAKWYRENGWL